MNLSSLACLAASLVFPLSSLQAAAPPTAGVWIDPVPPLRTVAPPQTLVDLLQKEGLQVVKLSTADLTNSSRLDPKKLQLLVIPYKSAYPAGGLNVLQRYLQSGGGFIVFGSERFSEPLFNVGGRWLLIGSGKAQSTSTTAVAWNLANHGPGEALKVSGDGSPDRPFKFVAEAVKSSMYAGMNPAPLPDQGAILCFDARGDQATPHLCLELQEVNGSRWKHVIELSTEWRSYRLHSATFASYATPSRTNDYFRGAKAKVLYFGLVREMAPIGSHQFELRNLKFQEASVPSQSVHEANVPLKGRELSKRYFGRHVPSLPANRWPDYITDGAVFTDARLTPAVRHPLLEGLKADALASTATGRVLLENPSERFDTKGEPVLLFPESANAVRAIPLLEASESSGKGLGLAAGLFVHGGGKYAGGRWAIFGLDGLDPNSASGKATLQVFARAARYIANGTVVPIAPPVFSMATASAQGLRRVSAAGEEVAEATVKFSQPLGDRSGFPKVATLKSSISQPGAANVESTKSLRVPSLGKSIITLHDFPLNQLNWRQYEAETEISVGGALLDRTSYRVNARQALRDLCDFMVARSAVANGKLSGTHYFVDHRGARTLLAAYEIFDDDRYRQAAIAWARVMVSEQRKEDGGYRMGYGIGSRGESCFVADGGEIALGVLRAACYATGEDQKALLESVQAYMGFRESFRVAGGGIGVGWSATDFSKRPTVRLDKPEKIFAPEMNTYTIGCTLGAAYVWAAFTGRPEDLQSARADADWFMARSKSATGATAESFVLAHLLDPIPARKKLYEQYLRERFIAPIAESNSAWWLLRGGRASLDTHAMSYCVQQFGPDARLNFQMARSTSAMFAQGSPTSAYRLYSKPKLNHDEWIYLCFGGVGLAETVETGVTFKRLPGVK